MSCRLSIYGILNSPWITSPQHSLDGKQARCIDQHGVFWAVPFFVRQRAPPGSFSIMTSFMTWPDDIPRQCVQGPPRTHDGLRGSWCDLGRHSDSACAWKVQYNRVATITPNGACCECEVGSSELKRCVLSARSAAQSCAWTARTALATQHDPSETTHLCTVRLTRKNRHQQTAQSTCIDANLTHKCKCGCAHSSPLNSHPHPHTQTLFPSLLGNIPPLLGILASASIPNSGSISFRLKKTTS